MEKEPTLKEIIWACARKYASETGKIIDMQPQFWVAEDIAITTCCFGDVEFLNLDEIPDAWQYKEVTKVIASGGWGRMDYRIYVKA